MYLLMTADFRISESLHAAVWHVDVAFLTHALYTCAKFDFKAFFTALHGMQTRSSDENSVCPSVRPSVKRVHCDKTEESYV